MAQLDPSLILGFKPIQLPDPVNLLMQGLQAQHLQAATAGAQMEQQQKAQQFAATNQLNDMIRADPTLANDPNRLMSNGGTYAIPLVKNLLDTQKARADINNTQANTQKTTQDIQHQQIVVTGSLLGAAAQTGNPQNVLDAITKSPTIPEDQRAGLIQQAQADPLGFAKRFAMQALTPEQQMQQNNPTILPTEQGIAAVNKDGSGGRMVPNITGAASYQNGNPGVGPGVPSTAPMQQPGAGVNWEATLRAGLSDPDPAVRAEMQQRLVSMTPGLKPGFAQGAAAVPQSAQPATLGGKPQGTWELDPMTGQRVYAPKFANPGDVLGGAGATLSEADKGLAKQIANYDMAPMNGMALRNPRNSAIMEEAYRQNPSLDATQYAAKQNAMKAFSTGPQGNSLRSFAVATDHLDTLSQLVGALKNGDYPLINRLANTVSTQTGGTAPTNFDTAKDIVSKEVIKAIVGGGGGVSEREDLAKRMSNASTPAQLLQQIDYYKTLMGAQKDALVSQYENTTGRTDAATRFNFAKKGAAVSAPAGWNVQVVSQ